MLGGERSSWKTLQLDINSHVRVPLVELHYRFVRSGGPGGQHVNTSATQVELTFDVAHSPSLSEAQRQRILSKLKNLIDAEGRLHLTAQAERSQLRNRELVTERLRQLLAQALRVPKPRTATKPTTASKERRLQGKKQRAQVKQLRQSTHGE
jgi:ribosome-associated protein